MNPLGLECDSLHYNCVLCGGHQCADERPSPREHESICGDCSDGRWVEIAGTNIRWRTKESS